jgi:predicted adenylyl cyclase CyaB
MPLEIEIKLKLDAHDQVLQALRAVNAVHVGKNLETNIFFDRPDNSLRQTDTGLRVRLTTPINNDPMTHSPDHPIPSALLTVKGPAATTGLRSREAFDLTCTPHDQLIPLLKMLGFEQKFLFEKRRDTWQLDGCLIELDTLPHFGNFLEIEGPSEQTVQEVQRKLGLSNLPPHETSYSKMVRAHLKAKPGVAELRFR